MVFPAQFFLKNHMKMCCGGLEENLSNSDFVPFRLAGLPLNEVQFVRRLISNTLRRYVTGILLLPSSTTSR